MRKISKMLFVWGTAVALTACGQDAVPAGDLARDITIDSSSQNKSEKSGTVPKKEAERVDQEAGKKETGVFSFVYEKTTLTPGEPIKQAELPKYASVAEIPSCAFEGNDNVYQFGAFELTTYFEGEEERVYSVYLTDPNLPTTEGLCLGDTADDMKTLYGESYEEKGTACTYTKGNTALTVILNNNVVVSIEYILHLK